MFSRHLRLSCEILNPFKGLKADQIAHLHIGHVCKRRIAPHNRTFLKQHQHLLGSGLGIIRYASTDTPPPAPIEEATKLTDAIPEPPVIPKSISDSAVEAFAGEPSFESIGLGGWSPVGIIQNCFEFLHVTWGLPWWTAIVAGTLTCRILIFPLIIISQRNSAKMNNTLPQLQVLQLKMTEARQRDDQLEAARYGQEMMTFMKTHDVNPLKNMIVPLAQAPLFISFFLGLRGMANVPVDSLRTGGLWWFTDLTLPDQYYMLPLVTAATLFVTIEVGTEAARIGTTQNQMLMKYFLRAIPVIVFPLTMNFPSAILVYWVSTNFISLLQVSFLRIPAVREYFKIEKLITHEKTSLPIKDKGFIKGVKESWSNMKLTQELQDRQRADQIQFMQSGRGAVKKTYKYDPTQPRPTAISAKKKDV